MTRNEYLSELSKLLRGMQDEDKNEILYDYEEHFRVGMEMGKTEDEIAASLGDVRTIAKQFKADYSIKQAEESTSTSNIFRAVLATVGMGFFNMVFVLGPYFGLMGMLIGLFAAAAGIIVAGLGIIVAVIASPIFPDYISMDMNGVFAVFSAIGITCFGLLFLIGDCYLAKFFYKATVRYLKWNIEIIKK